MTATAPISRDRQSAIKLMQRCGWTHRRDGKMHKFLGEGCGLHGYDVAKVSHKNLSLRWAIFRCGDSELERRLEKTRQAWVREVLPAAFQVEEEV